VAPASLKQALAGVAGALLGTLAVHAARDLPWDLAAVVGVAIGVLVVVSLKSGARVRAAWRRPPDDD
jgi:uncharacterized membrane protein YgaE (UPF0421/DUF939 family)